MSFVPPPRPSTLAVGGPRRVTRTITLPPHYRPVQSCPKRASPSVVTSILRSAEVPLPLPPRAALVVARPDRMLARTALVVILPPVSLPRPCVLGAWALMTTSPMLLAVAFTLIPCRTSLVVDRHSHWFTTRKVTLVVLFLTVSHL